MNFSEIGNTIVFWAKKLMNGDIHYLMKSYYFKLFGDGKYGLFLSQKVGGKMVYTWSFWAYHDIPGLGKYGFRAVLLCLYYVYIVLILNVLNNFRYVFCIRFIKKLLYNNKKSLLKQIILYGRMFHPVPVNNFHELLRNSNNSNNRKKQ